MSRSYWDERGRHRTSRRAVQVNEFGQIVAHEWTCPRCKAGRFYQLKLAGTPVCENCDTRMRRIELRCQQLVPWSVILRAVDLPLRAVWVGAAVGAAGWGAEHAGVPWPVPVLVVGPAGLAAMRVARRYLITVAGRRGRLDADDPGSGKRLRAAIDRRARAIGYCVAGGCAWTTLAATAGVDPTGPGGKVSLLALVMSWLPAAATWWRYLRVRQARTAPPPAEDAGEVGGTPPLDPDEAQTRNIWTTIVAARKDQVIGPAHDGREVRALRSGKLVDSWIEDWHRVSGGCGFTAVGPDGMYVTDNFLAARGAVASAYRMKTSMVTTIPDAEDENRALFLLQRISPIAEVVRWSGPASIDVNRGVAPVAVYCDGEPVLYEIYRPEWGVPHVAAFGSTGSGKSEFLNTLFTIDRWAHFTDAAGRRRGLVANFLIDPQQGQSFAPFIDELAAPVACTLEQALVLVRALNAEGLRRNRYLARVEWFDPRRKKMRRGRKWWNPLVDGPILSLTIDEAHDHLSHREFCSLVTKAGRMWRKCGMQVRLATHTPLLVDLGGSMALRDMLTGCFVWVGRTANSLSGPTAFNGRLPVDPRTIPQVPGMAYILTGLQPKAMLARTMWEPDYYDWIRDDNDQPIGYPAELPPETLAAFGPEYARWVAAERAGDGLWTPEPQAVAAAQDSTAGGNTRSVDCVLSVLAASSNPMDMDELDAALRHIGNPYSTRTVREGLKRLRETGLVYSAKGRHELTPQARGDIEEQAAAKLREAGWNGQ